MNKNELIRISDCSLLQAEEHDQLTFREKIEMCRLIDKLGVYSIDMGRIRQHKIDSLLVKSVCSAVKNAMISVPVDIMNPQAVQFLQRRM